MAAYSPTDKIGLSLRPDDQIAYRDRVGTITACGTFTIEVRWEGEEPDSTPHMIEARTVVRLPRQAVR